MRPPSQPTTSPEPPPEFQAEEDGPALRPLALLAGPLAALCVWLVLNAMAPTMGEPARRTAAVLVLMGVWWLTEALHLAITALLPMVLFPLLGVLAPKAAAAPYADRIIFLYMGGFWLALAMERWGLHRRIALTTILLVGTGPRRIVLGLMVATAALSMWMSNTATTLLMLPIALGIIDLCRDDNGKPGDIGFARCLVLGVAYAASIGGVATPIGSPPNAVLMSYLDTTYHRSISFAQWMSVGIPFVVVFIPVAWLLLTRVAIPVRLRELPGGRAAIRSQLHALGGMSRQQWGVLVVFCITVAGWTLREPLKLLFPDAKLIDLFDDTAVALLGGGLLFVWPAGRTGGRLTALLDWQTAKRLPWDVLLLFGGGLSLAAAIQSSGLDKSIGDAMSGVASWPPWVVVLLMATVSVFASEFTSNVAQANVFYPLVGPLAIAAGLDPARTLIAICIALSCAFMMPMGTPPNAIAFSTGLISMRRMAGAGFLLNLLTIALVVAAAMWLIPAILPLTDQLKSTAPHP